MKKRNPVLTILPFFLLWAMLVSFFWSWIFSLITDTSPDRKVTVFVDSSVCEETLLAAELEKALPESLRMVKVHRFAYAMMNSNAIRTADLYLVPACDILTYRDWFAPVPEAMLCDGILSDEAGVPIGIPVYDPATGFSIAGEFIGYEGHEHPEECWYLVFGAGSVHAGTPLDSTIPVARTFLSLTDSMKE